MNGFLFLLFKVSVAVSVDSSHCQRRFSEWNLENLHSEKAPWQNDAFQMDSLDLQHSSDNVIRNNDQRY